MGLAGERPRGLAIRKGEGAKRNKEKAGSDTEILCLLCFHINSGLAGMVAPLSTDVVGEENGDFRYLRITLFTGKTPSRPGVKGCPAGYAGRNLGRKFDGSQTIDDVDGGRYFGDTGSVILK